MIENIEIEKLRKDAVSDIKEKVRKNSKFLHPCNKEKLEYQKKLKFKNGCDFTVWMQQNGIMKNSAHIYGKQREKTATDAGFNNYNLNDLKSYEWTYKLTCLKEIQKNLDIGNIVYNQG